LRLLTKTPRTWHGLHAFGLEVVEQVSPLGGERRTTR
jgi:GTP cyclohydrolase II